MATSLQRQGSSNSSRGSTPFSDDGQLTEADLAELTERLTLLLGKNVPQGAAPRRGHQPSVVENQERVEENDFRCVGFYLGSSNSSSSSLFPNVSTGRNSVFESPPPVSPQEDASTLPNSEVESTFDLGARTWTFTNVPDTLGVEAIFKALNQSGLVKSWMIEKSIETQGLGEKSPRVSRRFNLRVNKQYSLQTLGMCFSRRMGSLPPSQNKGIFTFTQDPCELDPRERVLTFTYFV